MVTTFANPHSYTGEDVVEISCHGNPLITRRILGLCIKYGARLAEPGEFTRRAFLSGKLDLTQAEAVLDLIQAKTNRGSQAALSALRGNLGRQIELIRNELKQLLTSIVASIDFPDEVDQLDNKQIESVVEQSLIRLQELLSTSPLRQIFARRFEISNSRQTKRRKIQPAQLSIESRSRHCH